MGLNPQLKTKMPERVSHESENYKEHVQEMIEWMDENPGYYFRSNWWGWRPIVTLCDMANKRYELGIDLSLWGENSGAGLKSHDECVKLANALDYLIGEPDSFVAESGDRMYMCLGMWCTEEGGFLMEYEDELNMQYPPMTILNGPVALENGTLAYPAHSCSTTHVRNFISFLKYCGGFEIW